ncbi:MAG: YkgJ family cysteine cluster protein [Deltaproteobacteria bacterium]|nr:YkgJ family cysteine cluster protein [Deltaproteobacteria bacterium]
MSLPPKPSGEARRALLSLHARIETFWDRVVRVLGDAVGCRPGCDACCGQVLSLRPVEAAYLWEGARELPRAAREVVRRNLGTGTSGCPLLHAGICLSYGHRPVVCRTHGLLLLRREGGRAVLHHCPENFQGLAGVDVPGTLVLEEERLGLLADAVDGLYRRETGWPEGRIPLDRMLRQGLGP